MKRVYLRFGDNKCNLFNIMEKRKKNRIDKLCLIAVLLCAVFLSSCSKSTGVMVTKGERDTRSKWVQEHLKNADSQLPFSFLYDGKTSGELLKTWPKRSETKKLDQFRTRFTNFWKDDRTGLEVRCESIEYSDFSTVEWTVYFRRCWN